MVLVVKNAIESAGKTSHGLFAIMVRIGTLGYCSLKLRIRSTIVFFLFFIAHFSASAQGYRTISTASEASYADADGYIYAIKADSIVGTDPEVFYNFRVSTPVSFCSNTPFTTVSWLGEKVLLYEDGRNIFYNRQSEPILFQTRASQGQSWTMYTSGITESYFVATVIEKRYQTVLGSPDSVKVISLQLKNKSGANLPHPFNSYNIILSKTYGLVETIQIRMFSDDLKLLKEYDSDLSRPFFSSYFLKLMGNSLVSGGFMNLTSKEIFDFNVGDEFHFSTQYQVRTVITYGIEIMNIIDKNTNGDSVTYTYDLWTSSRKTDFGYSDIYTHKKTQKKIVYNGKDRLSAVSGRSGMFVNNKNDIKKTVRRSFEFFGCQTCDSTYIKAWGGPYYDCTISAFRLLKGSRKRVYSEKNGVKDGTPVDTSFVCNGTLAFIKKYVQDDTVEVGAPAKIEISDSNGSTYKLWINDVEITSTARTVFDILPEFLNPGVNTVRMLQIGTGDCSRSLDNVPGGYDDIPLRNIFVKVITSLDEEEKPITLYPNPNSGRFRVEHDLSYKGGTFTMKVVDLLGRVITARYFVNFQGSDVTFDLDLNEGIYLLVVEKGHARRSRRLLIHYNR